MNIISHPGLCGCCPDDLNAMEETPAKDSQAGSVVLQDSVKNKTSTLQWFDLAEMNSHLQNHAYIKTPDFEMANTPKL